MNQPISKPDFWNRVAAKYAAAPIRNEAAFEATLTRVRAHLSPGDHLLEFGAGTGTTTLKLAPSVAHITATDYAQAMIEIARTRATEQGAKNVTFTEASLDSAPEGPFDAVLAFNLMHLLPDLDAGLTAAFARVRPGGLFISKTICLRDPAISWKIRLALRTILPVLQFARRVPYFIKLRIADYDAAITRAGFEIVETGLYPERPPSRFIVARRPN
ncbi:class I SAM-dependent methyltransferase [Rhodalgimonas zhirmunskyi]|uniref:Class I SAM-dependent methyltransferase n=1 Tax=Rhodalgimonas zhirmunskyi TaxID=2964767 RepID=A0AAJ1UAC6_9RHOB|nr:class I SAM-dependent methyltransferase [Rhodoalgimonas zhirmunskyi]MDQ2094740.1 class I SAM-dependent methyltransferase [Rhodoalgimonas zhirmunskyi]